MHYDLFQIRQDCPRGSIFYSCGPPSFFRGCCSEDACTNGGCSTDAAINIPADLISSEDATSTTTTAPKMASGVGAPVTSQVPTPASPSTPYPTVDTIGTDLSNTGVVPPAATAASPFATSSTNPHDEETTGILPQTAIAGISVGATIGLVGVILIIFLLVRRRKQSRRVPSSHDSLRDAYGTKMEHNNHSVTRPSEGHDNEDVFAAFGGRVNSSESSQQIKSPAPSVLPSARSQPDGSYPRSPAHSYIVSPVSPQSTGAVSHQASVKGRDGTEKKKASAPAAFDSNQFFFELDSADTERPAVAELPMDSTAVVAPRPKSEANQTASAHGAHLMPGSCVDTVVAEARNRMPGSFPDTVVQDAKKQSLTRVRVGEASVVSVGNHAQQARPGSYDGAYERAPRLRATMNATDDDVQRNRHVNSWTHL
ncbi:uncharacterized protein JN550_009311 [Neoarthrinium moseri]|uniref:uncharacterized protein n=1 Tax=Neoarthrinium moseri TaxID=1658444 RepID=UPI001FDE5162|nr:uncharacterized protein JN550_009311 [Neoarthrinium moseri]KAI1863813.1 hypothetical protein JN550_009311 [Neoarthrinium moseri]